MKSFTRRSFIAATPMVALPALVASEQPAAAMLRRISGGPALGAYYPTQDPEDVRGVVGASHTRLEEVTELVTKRPTLARAAWDWGFGDWESALGAASHMGRRDIAEVLMGHGARANLFTFAMLGQVDVVRAICEAMPGIQRIHGPHGITLLRHAKAGREQAQDVVDYLTALGGADESPASVPLDEAAATIYLGQYEPVGLVGTQFNVAWNERQQCITFQRGEQVSRFLLYAGNHVFHPNGAGKVRIVFEVIEDVCLSLTIHDGEMTLAARRAV